MPEPMKKPESQRILPDALKAFCQRALSAAGLSSKDHDAVASALVLADSMGVFTHGTKLLGGYLNRLRGGGYIPKAQPIIAREGPAWAIVDGANALGQVGGAFAMNVAIEKAKTFGVAYLGLKNTGHIGAAGYYAVLAAQAGMAGLVLGNDIPSVAAPGSRGPVLGSNPLAYSIPVPGGDPILLDMATAAVAGGKVYAAFQRGEAIPDTWLVGTDGKPTTDGKLYPHQASLAPMAGHKGYGIALWAEILSAVIPGGAVTWQVGSWMFDEPSKPSSHNAAFLAIDVMAISGIDNFTKRIQGLIQEIREAPPAQESNGVQIPGQREWAQKRDSEKNGIPLPQDVLAKLNQVAIDWNLSTPWNQG